MCDTEFEFLEDFGIIEVYVLLIITQWYMQLFL